LDTEQGNKKFNNNVAEWLEKFNIFAKNNSYLTKTLGDAFGHPIVLYYPQNYKKARKNVLLMSLFHGDEIAGLVALYEKLHSGLLNEYKDLAISFIPITNPTGFELNQRMNKMGKNPNRGFVGKNAKPSVEGEILLKNSDLLFELVRDGFLSLHEDSDVKEGYYIYSYESDLNAPLGRALLEINKYIMSPLNGNIITEFEKGFREDLITDGLVLNEFGDGTYEEMLIKEKICSTAVVTETPSHKDVPFEKRVELNKNYIKAFLDFVR